MSYYGRGGAWVNMPPGAFSKMVQENAMAESQALRDAKFAQYQKDQAWDFVGSMEHEAIEEKIAAANAFVNENGILIDAIFNEKGFRVPAKILKTRFGIKWAIFADATAITMYGTKPVAWVNPAFTKRTSASMAKKGYTTGTIRTKMVKFILNAESVVEMVVEAFDKDAEEICTEKAWD